MQGAVLESGEQISAPIDSDQKNSVQALILDSGEKIPVPDDPETKDTVPIKIDDRFPFPSGCLEADLLSNEEIPVYIEKGGKREPVYFLLRWFGYAGLFAFGLGIIILLMEYVLRNYYNPIAYVVTNRRIIKRDILLRKSYITLDDIVKIEFNKKKNGEVVFIRSDGGRVEFINQLDPHELLKKTYLAAVNYDGRGTATKAAEAAFGGVEQPKDFD